VSLTAADCEYVYRLVRQRAGIVLDADKAYLVETRLAPLARQGGFESIQGMLTHSQASPHAALRDKLVEALTTNETSFYRDVRPFDALREVVLPDLLRKRAAARRLEVWCAAASTGQEPYTLAMLLREHFPELAGWDVRLTATDISTDVLARARAGCYSQVEVNRGLPAPLLAKYFSRVGANWKLADDIRRMVDFRPLNLIERWPDLGRPDLVLIRNVLIYFDVPTKKDILARARRILRPDGYLMLGGGETTLNLDDGFERVDYERAGVYRLRSI
jgi:chemotaxis protein methyltransferase CheR